MNEERDPATGLDPWPAERPAAIVVIQTPEGCFVDSVGGKRLLRIPRYPQLDDQPNVVQHMEM